MEFKNYYKILGIDVSSNSFQIKNAFLKQSKIWHPDKNPNQDTTQKMQDINEAYLILKDEEARKLYDIEFDRFYKMDFLNRSNESKNFDYKFKDEKLEKWILNARKQSIELAKEVIFLSKKASKASFSRIIQFAITYFSMGILILVLLRMCN